ncbi:hypothetical protein NKH10_23920 [Mesorhizobium sp. M1340]|uniref:hypothetical protein n=1 Tax=unclassified Mesorhizobium TaxID=325217 RepID=UPI003337367B
MASQQLVALFILFDACERDLVAQLRTIKLDAGATLLNEEERQRARGRRQRRESASSEGLDDHDLLYDLDIGDKFSVLMRHKAALDEVTRTYYTTQTVTIEKAIPVRNTVMHGRPLTTTEYVTGFSVANELRKTPAYWPVLESAFQKFEEDPQAFLTSAIGFLDAERPPETLHNLPEPDYDDTGFLPRPELERTFERSWPVETR